MVKTFEVYHHLFL